MLCLYTKYISVKFVQKAKSHVVFFESERFYTFRLEWWFSILNFGLTLAKFEVRTKGLAIVLEAKPGSCQK